MSCSCSISVLTLQCDSQQAARSNTDAAVELVDLSLLSLARSPTSTALGTRSNSALGTRSKESAHSLPHPLPHPSPRGLKPRPGHPRTHTHTPSGSISLALQETSSPLQARHVSPFSPQLNLYTVVCHTPHHRRPQPPPLPHSTSPAPANSLRHLPSSASLPPRRAARYMTHQRSACSSFLPSCLPSHTL